MASGPFFEHRRPETHFDTAFDPEQNFMFEASDEELQNAQRDIASLQMLQPDGNDAMPSDFMDPTFFEQGGLSPASQGWPTGQSFEGFSSNFLQTDIINGRANSVVQQFGQITPPDDGTPTFSPSKQKTMPGPSANTTTDAKSERARNAANQRHAKAKKARTDGARDVGGADVEIDDVDDKKERYREKNRLAAAKCRSKKKTHTESLEDSARYITAQNNKLKAEERELRDMFSSLRHQALAHDPAQGCICKAIHMYNNNKAQEAARGAAMQFAAHSMPSPSLSSNRSAVESPTNFDSVASRTHSFSGVRPSISNPPGRSRSLAGPLGVAGSPVISNGGPWGVPRPDEANEMSQSMSLDQQMDFSR